jgi:hypothetical protein
MILFLFLLFCLFVYLFIYYYVGIAWLFSIRLLCRRIELAYCMAMVFISLNVWFIEF